MHIECSVSKQKPSPHETAFLLKKAHSYYNVASIAVRAHSSVVERHIDIVKARGSIPRARTTLEHLDIIYENKYFAAVDKPAGVLFDWVLQAGRPDLIPVHRLDKDTSGVILFAKDQETADYFKSLFQSHQIQKTYRALVVGSIEKDSGTIHMPLARSASTPLKRVAVDSSIGRTRKLPKYRGVLRDALTEYKVLKRFDGHTYIEALPKTGRTHQIRAHFAAIGHPLVCDPIYAGKRLVCPPGLGRHFLHALSVEFVPPHGKKKLKLKVDLPKDLKKTLAGLTKK